MEDYIKRETAVAFLENMAASRYLIQCFQDKERFPAENVRFEQHGKWEWFAHDSNTRTCSNCHISQTVNVYNDEVMYNYCPYCGAKMDGGKNNDK